MLRKKTILKAMLLLMIYGMLMYQETVVNPVLCHKDDGSMMFELAVMDFQCQCSQTVAHCYQAQPCQPDSHRQLCPEFHHCHDLPINSSWLVRDIKQTGQDPLLVKQYNLDRPLNIVFNNGLTYSPQPAPSEPITVSKFLNTFPYPTNSVILRC